MLTTVTQTHTRHEIQYIWYWKMSVWILSTFHFISFASFYSHRRKKRQLWQKMCPKFPIKAPWTAHSHFFVARMFITKLIHTSINISIFFCVSHKCMVRASRIAVCHSYVAYREFIVSVGVLDTNLQILYVSMESECKECVGVLKRIDTQRKPPQHVVVVTRYTND